ncbi:hypothetical protein LOTGIDRAFT_199248 [Lottia gigantea]|uniref:EF-hand domain-containing protein n=1 Tax=Lottia gigantea TaxID=225164 RepID=V4B084_LOTGI|nr:hypothetical protein LOTGIDRAFT_199248 [Lottia gigantea]ESP03403.1 hypothetical protein LOTGIDRAFT_199248 [Lottia gigantea]
MAYNYGPPQGGYPGQPGGYPQQGGYPGQGYPPQQGGGAGGFAPPTMGAPVDPQIAAWFQAVDQDRSGKITVFELQRALTNANYSQFNAETCRLMIGMFDRDMSGTIDINEFQALYKYIDQWKGVFERFDGNRSGFIDCNELRNAYASMGYNLSPQFAQMVTYKFDIQARRALTLDMFIQSCVMLKGLTDSFKQRDPQMRGQITLGYEDFMTMAVFNKA